MSILSRFFGTRPDGGGAGDLEKRLKRLEAEAENAAPGYVGTSYNRAGDMALKAEQPALAAEYYGRAIDAFLKDGQREAARGVANKIIRVRPTAVRTLCTLTWLDLAAQHRATALLHLRDYVDAAKKVDQYSLAASQIYEMARVVPETEFIAAVADALDGLDFSDRADDVRAWITTKGSPESISDDEELSEACMLAAVKSNERGSTPMTAPADPEREDEDVDLQEQALDQLEEVAAEADEDEDDAEYADDDADLEDDEELDDEELDDDEDDLDDDEELDEDDLEDDDLVDDEELDDVDSDDPDDEDVADLDDDDLDDYEEWEEEDDEPERPRPKKKYRWD